MRIALGADHAGVAIKTRVKQFLDARHLTYRDFGPTSDEVVDYPDYAAQVARGVACGAFDYGILICGSGIGMAIAANKVRGIRAAPVGNPDAARLCREHNDANVLALGARTLSAEKALHIVEAFLVTLFGGGRHQRRIDKITTLEAQTIEDVRKDDITNSVDTTVTDRRRAVADTDPEIAQAIRDEVHRQNTGLELIASENFVSAAVLEAMGSVLTNKYAEGYPGRRYYGGCDFVDVAESLAIDRAKALFGADHANVQPHSGAQANMAAYFALLKPGDTVLGMNLAHGGHLTHGHPLNFSGQLYKIVPYGVRREDEQINYDELALLAREHTPQMIMVGASAYPRVIDFARISKVATEVGAAMVTDMAHIAGLVAAGVHPSPVPYSDIVTTTTHKTLRGPRGGLALCREAHAKSLNRAVFPGVQGGPLMHIIAAKAICLKEATEPGFASYQRQIVANAQRLAASLSANGFRLVSGGTDNHLLLVDVFSQNLTGKVAEAALGKAGITVNKNAIPFDENPPMVASGIRLGTPAVTTRGMAEPEMDRIGEFISRVLATPEDDRVASMVRAEVEGLCRTFPLYPESH